jgi:Cytochrome c554 and c-prime
MVTPKSCDMCHAQQAEEFQASHHAQAGQILGSLDNVLGEDVKGPAAAAMGCQKCHGSVVKVLGKGTLDPATWPNEGIGASTRMDRRVRAPCATAGTHSLWRLRASQRVAVIAI